MSTNHTPNYNLSQWEADDQVLRTDFNGDNAKLDAALAALNSQATLLSRALPHVAFYVGQMGILRLRKDGISPDIKSMRCEAFLRPEQYVMSNGLVIRNGVLCLDGAGKTGTVMRQSDALDISSWSMVKVWVHYSDYDSSMSVTINGEKMPKARRTTGMTVDGIGCAEEEFTLYTRGSSSAQVTLNLTCGKSGSMKVYDYCSFFF